jgi:hypothetical protein
MNIFDHVKNFKPEPGLLQYYEGLLFVCENSDIKEKGTTIEDTLDGQ